MYLKRYLFFCLISLFSFSNLKGQSLKDRILIGHGFSIYTDYFKGPSQLGNDSLSIIRNRAFSLVTYTLDFRFILAELSKNTSISMDMPAAVGLSASDHGYGSFVMPVMLGFNHGNISGYSADKDKGFVVGAGIQYINSAIIKSDPSEYLGAYKTTWIEPCMNIGYRYWNRRNKGKELNLKVGYTSGKTINSLYEGKGNTGTYSVKLAFIIYPKY